MTNVTPELTARTGVTYDTVMAVKLLLRQFTPAEVSDYAGVSPVLQRQWRRRGILGARQDDKLSRFDFGGLGRMAFLRVALRMGASQDEALSVCPSARQLIDAALRLEGGFMVRGAVDAPAVARSVASDLGTSTSGHFRFATLSDGERGKRDAMAESGEELLELLSGRVRDAGVTSEWDGFAALVFDLEKMVDGLLGRTGPIAVATDGSAPLPSEEQLAQDFIQARLLDREVRSAENEEARARVMLKEAARLRAQAGEGA